MSKDALIELFESKKEDLLSESYLENIAKKSGYDTTEMNKCINSEETKKITSEEFEKIKDMNAADLDAAVRTIAGSARSMGVTVEGV